MALLRHPPRPHRLVLDEKRYFGEIDIIFGSFRLSPHHQLPPHSKIAVEHRQRWLRKVVERRVGYPSPHYFGKLGIACGKHSCCWLFGAVDGGHWFLGPTAGYLEHQRPHQMILIHYIIHTHYKSHFQFGPRALLDLCFKFFPHHPSLQQHLALKDALLVVGENYAIFRIYEEPTSARFPQKKLVNFGSVFSMDAVGVCSFEGA